MGSKLANNATTTLAGSITALASTMALATGTGARFPILAAGDWFPATLIKLVGAEVQREIVKVTARNLDVCTIERGFDGTTALSFAAGDKVELRPVAAVFNDKIGIDALTPYAKLAGGNSFTGIQKADVQRFKFVSLGSVSTSQVISFASAGTVALTAAAAIAVTFSNPPAAGEDQTMYLKITNGGGRVTFPGARVSKGVALGLTAAGKDLLAVWYDPEDQVYVVGFAFQDYK